MGTERLDLTAMVEDVDLPCDATRHAQDTEPAAWVVWQHKCCPERPAIGLLCNPCLIRILASTSPTQCGDCGHRTPRASDLLIRYERITKPPTGTVPAGS